MQALPSDRVPVFAVLGAYGGKLTHTDLHTLYGDADKYVAGQVAVQNEFGLDMIMTPFDYSAIAEAFGGESAYFADQAPNMKRPAASTAEEALALKIPLPGRTARLPVILDSARKLKEIYKDEVPLFAPIPGPCAMAVMMMGLEAWMDTILFDYPSALRLLEHSGIFFESWANALLDAGAAGLVVTESMASSEISTRSLFAEKMIPHIKTVFAQVHGPIVFHHGGGRIQHVLDLLPSLPNVVGAVIGSKDNLTEARKRVGSKLLLIGNLDNLSFPKTDAAAIFDKSTACLEEAAPGGPFILANSAADIPLSSHPDTIHAMREASISRSLGKIK